jgi:phosphoglycerate dehydrogenase-like enzyme
MQPTRTALVTSDFILDPWLEQVTDGLRQRGFEVVRGPQQKPPHKTQFQGDDLARYFANADLVVTTTRSIVDRAALNAAPRLQGVVFPTIGTESVDLRSANELGIAVAHGPTPENFNSMAEATVLLMLAMLYDLHGTERVLAENLPRPKTMKARMLMGKTVGLIGLGRIGRGVTERLQGWGVRVLVFDPYLKPQDLPVNAQAADLDAVLSQSDIVSVHTTLTDETRHMINDQTLSRMKPSAFLVNTARGGMIDEAALVRALRERRIAGAALDAFELEPLPADHPLRELDNVILTPHMVGHTQEIFDAIPETALENIDRLLRGEPPLYLRNPEVLERWRARRKRLAAA